MITPQTTDQIELQRFGNENSERAEGIRHLAAGGDSPDVLPVGFVGDTKKPSIDAKVSEEEIDRLREQGIVPEGIAEENARLIALAALRTQATGHSPNQRPEERHWVNTNPAHHLGGIAINIAPEEAGRSGIGRPPWSPNN